LMDYLGAVHCRPASELLRGRYYHLCIAVLATKTFCSFCSQVRHPGNCKQDTTRDSALADTAERNDGPASEVPLSPADGAPPTDVSQDLDGCAVAIDGSPDARLVCFPDGRVLEVADRCPGIQPLWPSDGGFAGTRCPASFWQRWPRRDCGVICTLPHPRHAALRSEEMSMKCGFDVSVRHSAFWRLGLDAIYTSGLVHPVECTRRRQRGNLVSMRSIPAAWYNQWSARGAGGEAEGGRVHRDTKDQGQASASPELAFRLQMGQPASRRCGGSGVAPTTLAAAMPSPSLGRARPGRRTARVRMPRR